MRHVLPVKSQWQLCVAPAVALESVRFDQMGHLRVSYDSNQKQQLSPLIILRHCSW